MTTPPRVAEIDKLPALVLLDSGWRDEYAELMDASGLVALSISVSGEDLSFLQRLPVLRGLVLNAGQVKDLSVLEALPALETLTLNTPSRPPLPVDFRALSRLRVLRAYWNPGFDSVAHSTSLESLFLFNPPDADLERFSALRRLRRFEVSQGRRLSSLCGVEALTDLAVLGLYGQSGLADLAGVATLDELTTLRLEGCRRIGTVDAIAGARRLEHLAIANCGDIESLRPLVGLDRLRVLHAWESTKVLDGDLGVLLELADLRELAMRERASYRPSVAEVERILAARPPHG